MVALWPATGDEDIAATGEGVGDEELELASLVPAGGEPRAVVALDPQATGWKSERRPEPVGELQWRWQVGEHRACQ